MSIETFNNLGWQYFGLSMFIILILLLVIVIWFYAKWETKGPKWKARFKRIWDFISKPFAKQDIKIKKGAVISDSKNKEIDQIVNEAKDAQELLNADNVREQHQKNIQKAQLEYSEKQSKKNKLFRKPKDVKKEENTEKLDTSSKSLDDLLKDNLLDNNKEDTIENKENKDTNTKENNNE